MLLLLLLGVVVVVLSGAEGRAHRGVHQLDLSGVDMTLRDDPIVGDTLLWLDGSDWRASRSDLGLSLAAVVPGDLLTDLQNAELIPDPLVDNNFLNSLLWAFNTTWTYSKRFTLPDAPAGTAFRLVFDGVKMGARVAVNGKVLGVVQDQFLRYSFPLEEDGLLTVTFDPSIDVQGRFMACTGGWDWAPYTNTFDQHQAQVMTRGIWKSVYVVGAQQSMLEYLTPLVSFATDPGSGQWDVKVKFSVRCVATSAPCTGRAVVTGSWGAKASRNLVVQPGTVADSELHMLAHSVPLWRVMGTGVPNNAANLFDVTLSYGGHQTTRRVGFRAFELLTEPTLIGKQPTTMLFRINGRPMWMRGSNMIPLDELEGRYTVDRYARIVDSAMAAGVNVLRIWGGGIFLHRVFYDMLDLAGIVAYHDMMYAQQGHSPLNTTTQADELRHNVLTLGAHPSIVVWDSCNECGGYGVYQDFVAATVASLDASRAIWPSCPSEGWTSGVDKWGRPNGDKLVTRPTLQSKIETHGPYEHGTGFVTVNDPSGKLELFDANVPPALHLDGATAIGSHKPGVFASEFGGSVMSNLLSMTDQISERHRNFHDATVFYQRNYPCDNYMAVYFGTKDVGSLPFAQQVYQCIVGQMIELSADISVRRSTNEWGTIIWQLGEVWSTGGWGSLDYNGQWKPIHHMLVDHLYADVFTTCTNKTVCMIRANQIGSLQAQASISSWNLKTGALTLLQNSTVMTEEQDILYFKGASSADWPADLLSGASILRIDTFASSNGPLTVSKPLFLPLVVPSRLQVPPVSVALQFSPGIPQLKITTNATVSFGILDTRCPGHFERNVLFLNPGTTLINFIPWGRFDSGLFANSTVFMHI